MTWVTRVLVSSGLLFSSGLAAQPSVPMDDPPPAVEDRSLKARPVKPTPLKPPPPRPVKPNPPAVVPDKPPIPHYPIPQPAEGETFRTPQRETPPLPTTPPPRARDLPIAVPPGTEDQPETDTVPPTRDEVIIRPEEMPRAQPPLTPQPETGFQLPASRANRDAENWTLLATYSALDMWVPSKWGVSVGYLRSAATTIEFEYLRGSLGYSIFGTDLGEISEERFTLMARWFGERNSFNYFAGLNYTELEAQLGDEYLNTLTGTERGYADLVEFGAVGLTTGLGNRWQTQGGFTYGADWLVINIPLWLVKSDTPFLDRTASPERAEDVRDWLRYFRRIPALATLKFQLGFSF